MTRIRIYIYSTINNHRGKEHLEVINGGGGELNIKVLKYKYNTVT